MAFDLTATSTDLLSRLGATNWADLNWCTEDEVYGYFQEALLRLAELGLFVERHTQNVAASTGAYALDVSWLDSMHVSVDGHQLRPASTAELQALDSLWVALLCSTGKLPSRYSMDAGQLGTITLYPVPSATGELATIDHSTADTITADQTSAPVPSVVSDYFLYFALQRVRSKESAYAMPEVAAAAASQCQMYEQIFRAYWGGLE